jgi:hypothetical protein
MRATGLAARPTAIFEFNPRTDRVPASPGLFWQITCKDEPLLKLTICQGAWYHRCLDNIASSVLSHLFEETISIFP